MKAIISSFKFILVFLIVWVASTLYQMSRANVACSRFEEKSHYCELFDTWTLFASLNVIAYVPSTIFGVLSSVIVTPLVCHYTGWVRFKF